MKASLLTLGFLLVCHAASAADLTLNDGRTFRDAAILSQTPRNVVIQHADGLTGVSKTLLPTDLATRYPLDEAAALAAERQAAEARARAHEFHKAEADRAARVRLEREQTVLHNAQVAALEATERLAEAEAARIANQRTEVVYEYVSFNRTPYYVYSPSRDRDCEPRWNEKPRNPRLVRDDRARGHERNLQSPDRTLHQRPDYRRAHATPPHNRPPTSRVSVSQAPQEEEKKTQQVAAAGVVRR